MEKALNQHTRIFTFLLRLKIPNNLNFKCTYTFRDEQTGFQDLIQLPDSIASKMTELELINYTFPNLDTK